MYAGLVKDRVLQADHQMHRLLPSLHLHVCLAVVGLEGLMTRVRSGGTTELDALHRGSVGLAGPADPLGFDSLLESFIEPAIFLDSCLVNSRTLRRESSRYPVS